MRGTFIRIYPRLCDDKKVNLVSYDKILADKRFIYKG